MRVSITILLALLTVVAAILLPIGIVIDVVYFDCGTFPPTRLYFMGTDELSISRLDILSFLYPGIESVFILWILVALIQVLNLLIASRGFFSSTISWLVFLPALVAQIYLPLLVLDLALPNPYLVSQVCEPNILCSLPVALGLVSVSFGNWLKHHGRQWERIGYG